MRSSRARISTRHHKAQDTIAPERRRGRFGEKTGEGSYNKDRAWLVGGACRVWRAAWRRARDDAMCCGNGGYGRGARKDGCCSGLFCLLQLSKKKPNHPSVRPIHTPVRCNHTPPLWLTCYAPPYVQRSSMAQAIARSAVLLASSPSRSAAS